MPTTLRAPVPFPPRFAIVTMHACAMALVLGRASPSPVKRARLARVVRYCRARGLRGPSSSWKVLTARDTIQARFDSADRF